MAACVILKIRASEVKIKFMRYLVTSGLFILCLLFAFRAPVQFIVKGKITDENGIPLGNVAITVKGTSKGTVSNSDGSFEIQILSEKATLVFTSAGFVSTEWKVSAKNPVVNLSMKSSTAALEEVVVIGYGARSKKHLTGSNISLERQLQGGAPGLSITNGNRPAPGYYDQPYFQREGYDAINENRFFKATENPLSTFSIDVDAASYSNVRRMLNMGQMPPAGAVRIEEMINYFKYDYPQPKADDPFSISTEMADCPWNSKHKLVMIGLQGKKIATENLPPSNLVFLIDVSGSMSSPDKLPLVKQSIKMLAEQLRPQDKVAMVVYAGNAGLVLPATDGSNKSTIKEAVDRLEAGGSTAGGAGIKLAYEVARKQFVREGNNRVILCTDGDFNVGASSDDELERMIEKERESGVFLTVLGFGTGNYQDAKMQKLADKGNGNHAYIDGLKEARKVLVAEFGGTLFTIAKDVKLQIEFNPAKVQGYRLVGYENRLLNKEDFNDDKKDAGELGSGHTVTAMYEIIPVGVKSKFIGSVDKLKYQKEAGITKTASPELMTIKFRYKKPDGDASMLLEKAVLDESRAVINASENFRFAASVAEFGMLLRKSSFRQCSSYQQTWELANGALGYDAEGYRAEFLKLIRNAQSIAKNSKEEAVQEDEEDLSKR